MKTRIFSAIVMILLFVPLLIIGGYPFRIAGTILAVLSIRDLFKLNKCPLLIKLVSYVICGLITWGLFEINAKLLIILFLFYGVTMILYNKIKDYSYKDSLWIMCVTLVVGLIYNNFINVRMLDNGKMVLLYLFIISSMTDTFALFCGMKFGKHKLAKEISPKKTVEGAIGGSLIGTILATTFYSFFVGGFSFEIILYTFILTMIGQIGDLYFSSIKREHDIKDFSNLIPGHGGILDRLDSVLFIALTYMILF